MHLLSTARSSHLSPKEELDRSTVYFFAKGRRLGPTMALLMSLLQHAAAAGVLVPRGWNIYCARIGLRNESVQMAQARHQAADLLASGYDTFVLDGGWAQTSGGAPNSTCKKPPCSLQVLDKWGRPAPSDIYPSAQAPPYSSTWERI